jgi:Arc/MetJ-type ribon-helix-helix transcriptional regulator
MESDAKTPVFTKVVTDEPLTIGEEINKKVELLEARKLSLEEPAQIPIEVTGEIIKKLKERMKSSKYETIEDYIKFLIREDVKDIKLPEAEEQKLIIEEIADLRVLEALQAKQRERSL